MDADRLKALLASCNAGDRQALEEFLREIERDVGFIAAAWLRTWGSRADIEDVVQEALFAVSQNLRAGGGPETETIRAWVYAIVRNKCLDARRRHRRQSKGRVPFDEANAVAEGDDRSGREDLVRQFARIFDKLLASFTGVDREILVGINLGMTNEELAEQTGLTVATLRRRKAIVLERARRLAKELLEE